MAKQGSAALSIGLGAAILYLGAHAVTGRQGLMAYVDMQGRERALQSHLSAVEAERATLQARAARLSEDTIDLDYLDARARLSLAAGDEDELVFALND